MKDKTKEATGDGIVGSIVSAASIGYADKAVNTSIATYPPASKVVSSYLKKEATDMFYKADSGYWTATIDATQFTFTYQQSDGASR